MEMTANQLISNLQIRLTQQQKSTLTAISAQLNDAKLKQCLVHGIAFHHAGLMHENRYTIEDLFRKGSLSVLVSTRTDYKYMKTMITVSGHYQYVSHGRQSSSSLSDSEIDQVLYRWRL